MEWGPLELWKGDWQFSLPARKQGLGLFIFSSYCILLLSLKYQGSNFMILL